MRLAGQVKMGFYPTPPSVVSLIASHIALDRGPFAALDPCCGEGAALAQILAGTQGAGYGIELDRARFEKARMALHRAIHSDAFFTRISHGAFGLLWLNPPYDFAAGEGNMVGERLERRFLREFHHHLAPGGVLVYIVPEAQITPDVAKILAFRFEDLRLYRFPAAEFAAYRQVVVLGRKRPRGQAEPEVAERLAALAAAGEAEELGPAEHPAYAVPKGAAKVPVFQPLRLSDEDIAEGLAQSRLWVRAMDLTRSIDAKEAGRPPVSLHTGHLGLLLVSGYLDGPVGRGEGRHLIKGLVRKDQVTEVVETEDEDGGGGTRDTIVRDVYRVQIALLQADGTLRLLT